MSDQLFTVPFFYYSQTLFEKLRNEIQRMDSNQLDEDDKFINSLVSKHQLTELNIDWDSLKVLPNHREEESHYTDGFGDDVRTTTPVYTFEVEYSGTPVLFTIQPSSSRVMRLEADVLDDKIRFEIRGSDKSRLEQIKEGVKFNVENQKKEVGSFNGELDTAVRAAVERRKQELEKHGQGLNAFGVPVKDSDE